MLVVCMHVMKSLNSYRGKESIQVTDTIQRIRVVLQEVSTK